MGEGFTWDTQDRARDIAVAREACDEVKRMIADPSYEMMLADELNVVLRYDYLRLDEVLEVLAAKPAMTHVVVTGRNAPQALIDAADLVTEMTLLKNPFREQVMRVQAGIHPISSVPCAPCLGFAGSRIRCCASRSLPN